MSQTVGVISGRTISRSGTVLLARVVGANNANITQATLAAIAYQVRDLEADVSGALLPIVIATSIFDTLQTGGAWDADTTGYNFAFTVPASAFAWTPEEDLAGNPKPRRFRVDVRFTPVTGEPFVVPWALWVQPTWIGS